MNLINIRYSGPESAKESPYGLYIFAIIATWAWLFLWLFSIAFPFLIEGTAVTIPSLLQAFFRSLLIGAMVCSIFWARRRFLGHLRITPEGLVIKQASGKRTVLYTAIESVGVPKWVNGAWQVSFRDGSTPVIFLTGGSQTVVMGKQVQASSKFVDALQAKIDEAKGAEQIG